MEATTAQYIQIVLAAVGAILIPVGGALLNARIGQQIATSEQKMAAAQEALKASLLSRVGELLQLSQVTFRADLLHYLEETHLKALRHDIADLRQAVSMMQNARALRAERLIQKVAEKYNIEEPQ